MASLAMFRPTV